MNKLKHTLNWLLTVLWYILIWHMSAQPATASDAVSDEVITDVFLPGASGASVSGIIIQNAVTELLSFFVRKAAHIFLFFVLALLVWAALAPLLKKRPVRAVGTSMLCTVLAALDEYHQTLVPGRSGEVRDVFIDLIGLLLALLLLSLPILALKIQHLHHSEHIWIFGAVLSLCLLVYVGLLDHLPSPFAARVPYLSLFMKLSEPDRTVLLTACTPILRDILYLAICALSSFLSALLAALSAQNRAVASALFTTAILSMVAALIWSLPLLPSLIITVVAGLIATALPVFFPWLGR